MFKLLELVTYLGSVQRVSPKLEVCGLRERKLLQDQVQLGIGGEGSTVSLYFKIGQG